MRIHFAGADNSPRYNDLLHKAGVKNRLESYYSLAGKPPSDSFERLILDSGGFAARTRNVIISVEEYAKYIDKCKAPYAFNLDTNDVKETLDNQRYLEAHTKDCYIIPIYHLSDYLENRELLQQFVKDGYDYIGIGGVAGEKSLVRYQKPFYNYIFYELRDTVKTHGLGITARPMLEKYPWYSVDSTSWLATARYGNSISGDKLMTKVQAKKNHYLDNTQEEIYRWLDVQQYINQLWEKRGVHWD